MPNKVIREGHNPMPFDLRQIGRFHCLWSQLSLGYTQQGVQALVSQIWLCILIAHLDILGKNLTSLKLTLFRIRLYKEGNVCALVTQCLPSIQESWHKEHHVGHTGTSVMAMVCMPDTNSYATLKRAGLAVSPALNAYSESKRLDLLCDKIRKIKSNLF